MIGPQNFLMGYVTMTTLLSGVVCHPLARLSSICLSNLKTLFMPVTMIWKVMQNYAWKVMLFLSTFKLFIFCI